MFFPDAVEGLLAAVFLQLNSIGNVCCVRSFCVHRPCVHGNGLD
jgi:hypothetical protein